MRMSLFPIAMFAAAALLTGCERKPETSEPNPSPAPKTEAPAAGHSGEVIELGETTIDGMKVKASRDKGEIKPGGDSPIDIWIDGGLGNAAAVRFWIGTEDAKGSVKAKADVEAGHWHTHADIPDPLPAGSKLWVEIEAKGGKKTQTSFEMKM